MAFLGHPVYTHIIIIYNIIYLSIQTYPESAQNLNRFTMTVDVDIYDSNDAKVDIKSMPTTPIKVRFFINFYP